MDWNGNLKPFVSQPENSLAFLYNYNCDQCPGIEMKLPVVAGLGSQVVFPAMEEFKNINSGNDEEMKRKKKRLTNDQLESLERSFQDETKLDPERKMKLALDLGLKPRQVAVWFQNRRARWKAKQLQHLYDTLKKDFNLVSRERLKLQQEVLALKVMLKEQGDKKQGSAEYTEISVEETVESISVVNRSTSQRAQAQAQGRSQQQFAESSCVFNNIEDYSTVMLPAYWGALPSYP